MAVDPLHEVDELVRPRAGRRSGADRSAPERERLDDPKMQRKWSSCQWRVTKTRLRESGPARIICCWRPPRSRRAVYRSPA
jgi:hypothetical protein